MSRKEEVLELLHSVKREGMSSLIQYLEDDTDYFTSPASTKYHGNYEGGLMDHSLNVYDSLMVVQGEFDPDATPADSLIIVALLHDICKCNTYVLNDDPATDPQIKFVNDLLSQAGRTPLPAEYKTKGYVSKLIEHLKSGVGEYPVFTQGYKVKETLPMGHGEKSIYLIQKFIDLTDEEAMAIRWHLGAFEPGFHFGYPTGFAAQQAIRECPLATMMIAADFLATWLVDTTK